MVRTVLLINWLCLCYPIVSQHLLPVNFTTWTYHRSIVLGSWLYIDGGQILTSENEGLALGATVAIDLQQHWTNATVNSSLIDKPSTYPLARFQLMWTNNGATIYAFGGWPWYEGGNGDPGPEFNVPSGKFIDSTGIVEPRNSSEDHVQTLWILNVDGAGSGRWNVSAINPAQQSDLSITVGSLTASSETTYYSFSGELVQPDWKQQYDAEDGVGGAGLPGFVSVSNSDPLSWTNSTATNYTAGTAFHSPYIVWGESVFAPMFGTQGVLVAFGGYCPNQQGFRDLKNAHMGVLQNMSSILIMDIASETWFIQSTQGPTPSPRYGFCSVGVADQANATFDIFIFGGAIADGVDEPDIPDDLKEVYVLSLPAFTWTLVNNSTTNYGRFLHSCNVIGQRQMIVVGGAPTPKTSQPDPWFNGLGIFDLSAWSWSSSYEPDADAYERNEILTQLTRDSPYPPSWTSSEVAALFQVENLTAAPPSNSSSTATEGHHSTDAGAIAGGIVGGVAALLIILALTAFMIRGRNRKRSFHFVDKAQNPPYEQVQTTILPQELAVPPHELESSTDAHQYYGNPLDQEPQELESRPRRNRDSI